MADQNVGPGGLSLDQWQALQSKGVFDDSFVPPMSLAATPPPVVPAVAPKAAVPPVVPVVAPAPVPAAMPVPMPVETAKPTPVLAPSVKPVVQEPEAKIRLASDEEQPVTAAADPYRQLGMQEYAKGFAAQTGAIEAQKSAVQKAAMAEAGANAAQARQMQEDFKKQQEQIAEYTKFKENQQQELAAKEQKMTDMIQEVRDQKIDPNRLWNSKTTGDKVLAGIGVILGGIGAGLSRSGQNQAVEFMNQAITRDIDAQRSAIESKKTGVELENTLYGRALQRTNDAAAAKYAAITMGQEMAKQKLLSTAMLSKNPAVMANAELVAARLDEEIAKNKMEYGKALLASPAMVSKNQDLNVIMRSVPKEQQNDALKDYNQISLHLQEADNLKRVFNEIKANTGLMQRVSSPIQSKSVVEAGQSTITLLFKPLVGVLSESDKSLIENSIPKIGDSADTLRKKEQNMLSLWYSKTPKSLILEGYGVNPAERHAGATGLQTLKPSK